MAENSKIEWCDHSASPWHGCTKVSDGCDHCYAATFSVRNPSVLGIWGDDGKRVKSKSFIANLKRWNAEAKQKGKAVTVFPSLCDPFEDRPELVEWRNEMFTVVDTLPWIRLLLLTKRPENILRMWPETMCRFCGTATCGAHRSGCFDRTYRDNVLLGTSVENQKVANERIPHLLACMDLARGTFLSCEPLLGPIEFSNVSQRSDWKERLGRKSLDGIDQVIVGGESGPNARPMHPDWARTIRDQCEAANVAFMFKQWGAWAPCLNFDPEEFADIRMDLEGRDVTELPGLHAETDEFMDRVGKKQAGRLLDGVQHDGFPKCL